MPAKRSPSRRALAKATPDRTTAYARDVIAGRIVAGELVIAAARRHLDDLEHGPARGLTWWPDRAEATIDSYPTYFTITDGPNAGQPFELLPWMVFVTGSVFGWYRGDRRRFDEAWIETAKGQGKSPWLACTCLLAMGAMGRQRAEVYALAPKEEQAAVVLRDAAAAVRSQLPNGEDGETLESLGKFTVLGLGVNAHTIQHPASKSWMTTVSGNSTRVSGPRPFVVAVDEVHEMADAALIDMWVASLAKNAAGGLMLMCTNTPASSQGVGTYYSERAQRVVRGDDVIDSLFVLITRVDVADRDAVFDRPKSWIKAMPALGTTFPVENIEREVGKARVNPSEAARVKRLYFGIPTGAVDFWLDDSTLWDRALGAIDKKALVSNRCWLSLDLSDKHDLTAVSAAWEVGEKLLVKSWYWTRGANLDKRAREDRMPYDIWAANGFLNVVPGESIDKDFVALQVAQLVADQSVEFMTVDMAMLASFEEACGRVGLATWRYKPGERAGTGLKLVPHAQGTKVMFEDRQLCMPRSIEALEDRLRLGTITIDDNPVTTACAANAAPVTDATGNRAWDKKRSRGRIDGIVTVSMVTGAAAMNATALPAFALCRAWRAHPVTISPDAYRNGWSLERYRDGVSVEAPRGAARPQAWVQKGETFYGLEDPELARLLGGGLGGGIAPRAAMGVAAVYRCHALIAGAIANMPLSIKRRVDDRTREDATDHPLWPLLRRRPNPWQTPGQFRRYLQSTVLMRGNGYAMKIFSRGRVSALIPLNPDRVRVSQKADFSLEYTYTPLAGGEVTLQQRDMFHLLGMTLDGITGLSVLGCARETVGHALNLKRHGTAVFENSTRMGGAFSMAPNTQLTAEQYERLKTSLDDYRGPHNAGKTIILEDGMKFEPMAMTMADAQFIENAGFTNQEIYAFFGVPPHMAGDTTKATSWGSGIESLGQQFVAYTLQDWLTVWEETIARDLIPDTDPDIFARFNTAGLVRGNLAARNASYTAGRNGGWLSKNDIREAEDMNPIDGGDGDDYDAPLNSNATAGTTTDPGATAANANAPGAQPND